MVWFGTVLWGKLERGHLWWEFYSLALFLYRVEMKGDLMAQKMRIFALRVECLLDCAVLKIYFVWIWYEEYGCKLVVLLWKVVNHEIYCICMSIISIFIPWIWVLFSPIRSMSCLLKLDRRTEPRFLNFIWPQKMVGSWNQCIYRIMAWIEVHMLCNHHDLLENQGLLLVNHIYLPLLLSSSNFWLNIVID